MATLNSVTFKLDRSFEMPSDPEAAIEKLKLTMSNALAGAGSNIVRELTGSFDVAGTGAPAAGVVFVGGADVLTGDTGPYKLSVGSADSGNVAVPGTFTKDGEVADALIASFEGAHPGLVKLTRHVRVFMATQAIASMTAAQTINVDGFVFTARAATPGPNEFIPAQTGTGNAGDLCVVLATHPHLQGKCGVAYVKDGGWAVDGSSYVGGCLAFVSLNGLAADLPALVSSAAASLTPVKYTADLADDQTGDADAGIGIGVVLLAEAPSSLVIAGSGHSSDKGIGPKAAVAQLAAGGTTPQKQMFTINP